MRYGLLLGIALWATLGGVGPAHAQGAIVDRWKAAAPIVGLCSETTRTIRAARAPDGARVEHVSEQSASRECTVSPAADTAVLPRVICCLIQGAVQDLNR